MQKESSNTIKKPLSDLQKKLLNDFQHGLPLTPTPYLDIAKELGVTEDEVLNALTELQESKMVSRVGAVFRPNRIGVSTLAAMSVPSERINEVAAIVNAYPQVNHNYEREHVFNMWFVITASDNDQLDSVLKDMELKTGLSPMSLPMVEDYHIDLGFPLQWGEESA
ncbi:MAG: Lrp/AsnC family transcriptional regulator [Sulfuriflexus sp.]|nr:Lrp/AsnC family transcriptional regulator [Sulfuriflexus sp.]